MIELLPGIRAEYLQRVDSKNCSGVELVESERSREKFQDLAGVEMGGRNHCERNQDKQ